MDAPAGSVQQRATQGSTYKEMPLTLQGCLGMNGDEQERRAKELYWEQEHSRLLSVQ